MKPKYIFYFHDNKVQYLKKDEIRTYEFSLDCLLYGKVIHIEKFIKELKTFVKKIKINTFLSPTIEVIVPFNFYNVDQEIMIMAFNAIGINKVKFIKEYCFYPKKEKVTFLNIHDTYLIETTVKKDHIKQLFYPYNIFKDKKQLIDLLCKKKDIESFLLFGTYQHVPTFVDELKKREKEEVHYYNNYKTYIIERARKGL